VWRFVVNLWHLLDVAIVGLIVYSYLLYMDHLDHVHPALDKLRRVRPRDDYRESYWQARHEQLEDLVAGIVVLLSWIKV